LTEAERAKASEIAPNASWTFSQKTRQRGDTVRRPEHAGGFNRGGMPNQIPLGGFGGGNAFLVGDRALKRSLLLADSSTGRRPPVSAISLSGQAHLIRSDAT
jgi:hypothetical protein